VIPFFRAANTISWPWKAFYEVQIYLVSTCTCYPKSVILP
jgi:hypothetical protein